MRRLSIQLYRAFSTTVNSQTTAAKPVDPLKNVIGKRCILWNLINKKIILISNF